MSASLQAQTLRGMLGLVLGLAAALVLIIGALVLVPMAQRSAQDLAGLMVLSAQTWVELPPQTRPAFVREIHQSYRLDVDPELPQSKDSGLVHGLYLRFLEDALAERIGHPAYFQSRRDAEGHEWLWVNIPTGGREIGVGLDNDRVQSRPLQALLIGLGISLAAAVVLAVWWARRVTRPVAAMERAAAVLARGDTPELLPETGPRELARLAAHFNEMAVEIESLLQARTTLLAGVSHDLRTPLARMRLALELQRMQPSDARLDQIERDVAAMDTLIGQILQLARGLQVQSPRSLDLPVWLRERIEAHAAWAQSLGAQLSVDCAADLTAWADPAALQRIVDNLLANAVRHAGGEVCLQAAAAEEPGWTRLTVADRGPGIPPDRMSAMFEPFASMDTARTPGQGGGSGLGLSIARQLARQHGWRIGLAARSGGGLLAWVEVPARQTPREA